MRLSDAAVCSDLEVGQMNNEQIRTRCEKFLRDNYPDFGLDGSGDPDQTGVDALAFLYREAVAVGMQANRSDQFILRGK